MLVLTEKIGNSIFIDDNIELRIIKKKGNEVLIGVVAPKSLHVDRQSRLDMEEVIEKRKRVLEAINEES
jgi:carbon storage regulator